MPDIQYLTSQVKQFGESSAWWNSGVTVLIALTALVAVAYGLFAMLASRKGQQLQKAQASLIHAKDEQLARDLKERDLRIAEAVNGAAQANEKAKELEHANLILSKAVNEAAAKVADAQRNAAAAQKDAADAQKAAAEAIARQKKVETELARQQERAARAEAALAKLQPRSLSIQQRGLLLQALRASPKGPVQVFCLFSVPDGEQYAEQIKEALLESGWPATGVTMARLMPGPPPGISVAVRDRASLPPPAQSLLHALATAGLRANLDEEPDVPAGVIRLIVGHKPQ